MAAGAFWGEIRHLDAAVDFFRDENDQLEKKIDRMKEEFRMLTQCVRTIERTNCSATVKEIAEDFMVSFFAHDYTVAECPTVAAQFMDVLTLTFGFVELEFRDRESVAFVSALGGGGSGTIDYSVLCKFEGVAAELFAQAIPPPSPVTSSE